MFKAIILGTAALSMSSSALASIVKVDFDVTINGKSSGQGTQDPNFGPLEYQRATLVFDNTLSKTERHWDTNYYPINSRVVSSFGAPNSATVTSPVEELVNINPFPGAPVSTTSTMRSYAGYSFAPGTNQVSYFHQVGVSVRLYSRVSATSDPYGYAGASWERTIGLYSPTEYLGPLTKSDIESYTYTTDDLMAHLYAMQKTRTAFSFGDSSYYEERPSLKWERSGFGGKAVIRRITVDGVSEVPEPASIALFGLGVLGFAVARRKASAGSRPANA